MWTRSPSVFSLWLSVALALPCVAPAAELAIEPIVFAGELAPGLDGARFDYLGSSFDSPVVSDDGVVGFQATSLEAGRALFVATPGAVALVAREYGTVNGFAFGFLSNDGGLSFDDESRLVFESGSPGSAGHAASPTLVTTLVAQGDPLDDPPGQLTGVDAIASRHGTLLFEGRSTEGWGLYHQKDGFTTKVVVWGDPVPGHPGRSFAFLPEATRIAGPDASGRIAFPNLEDTFYDTGVYLWSPAGGLQTVAFTGDPAPGTGAAFDVLGSVHLNDAGTLVFQGRLDDPDQTQGIFRQEGATLEAVVLSGQTAPGTGGRTFASVSLRGLDDPGAIVFLAALEDGGSPAGEGIFRLADGVVEPLVLTGQVAPGTGGATYTDLDLPFTPEGALSPSGRFLAFQGVLSDGRVANFRGSTVATVPALPPGGAVVLALGLLLAAARVRR